MSEPRSVVILGSTGSIGVQAISVIDDHPGRFQVRAISAGGRDVAALAAQAAHLRVEVVGVADAGAVEHLRDELDGLYKRDKLGPPPEILAGPDAACEIAAIGAETVLNAITGSVGLRPTLAALRAGSTLALANKESLVAGGALVRAAVRRGNQIVPVDSEHSAIAQCLRSGRHPAWGADYIPDPNVPEPGAFIVSHAGDFEDLRDQMLRDISRALDAPSWQRSNTEVRRLILTASGGPFRTWSAEQIAAATPAQALAHPTWRMGPVVTINSASMVNKALELIEAHRLFDVPANDIVVVIHPQSAIHSMVEFHDGAIIAQASPPDMRIPIALGLAWPDRLPDVAPAFSWTAPMTWEFASLDDARFPAVGLARAALAASATHPAVYNAANEEAVAAFLAGRIAFGRIVEIVRDVVGQHGGTPARGLSLEDIEQAEAWARRAARALIAR